MNGPSPISSPSRFGPLALIVVAVAVHVVIVGSLLTQSRPLIQPLHNDTIHRLGSGADFYALYHASMDRLHGLSPYDPRPDGVTPYYFPFRYLPLVADAGRIALVFPPATAHRLWMLLLEALLAVLALWFWRRLPNRGHRTFAVCALLLSSPYFLELYMGQFTFATVGLFILSLSVPFGVLPFTLSALLKLFPLATAPALVRHRPYWARLIVASVFAVAFSVPYFAAHPLEFRAFLRINLLTPGALDGGNYGNIYLLWCLAHDLHLAPILEHWQPVTMGLRIVLLGGTALVVFFSRDDRLLLGSVAMMLAHFLCFGHEWEHHASAVVLLGLLLLIVESGSRTSSRIVVAAVVMLALPTPFALFDRAKDPTIWDPTVDWPAYAKYVVLLPKTLPTLTFFVIAMARLRSAGFRRLSPGG
jgi:hypothetical protein